MILPDDNLVLYAVRCVLHQEIAFASVGSCFPIKTPRQPMLRITLEKLLHHACCTAPELRAFDPEVSMVSYKLGSSPLLPRVRAPS